MVSFPLISSSTISPKIDEIIETFGSLISVAINSNSMVLPEVLNSPSNIFRGIITLASLDTLRAMEPSESLTQPLVAKSNPMSCASMSPYFHSALLIC